MNNDRNRIPKPLNVQVQELTVALERAHARVEACENLRQELEATNDHLVNRIDEIEEDRGYWKRSAMNIRRVRDGLMGDVLDLRNKIEAYEARHGLEELFVREAGFPNPAPDGPDAPRQGPPDWRLAFNAIGNRVPPPRLGEEIAQHVEEVRRANEQLGGINLQGHRWDARNRAWVRRDPEEVPVPPEPVAEGLVRNFDNEDDMLIDELERVVNGN